MENKDSIYNTKYKNLGKYKFRFKNKKWKYKNTEKSPKENEGYTDFFKETLDDIIKENTSSNFDENKKDEFLKQLEEKSGHKVINKENPEDNTTTIEKPSSNKTDRNTEAKRESNKKKATNPKETEKKSVPTEKPDGSNI
jgi:hypothetical protein